MNDWAGGRTDSGDFALVGEIPFLFGVTGDDCWFLLCSKDCGNCGNCGNRGNCGPATFPCPCDPGDIFVPTDPPVPDDLPALSTSDWDTSTPGLADSTFCSAPIPLPTSFCCCCCWGCVSWAKVGNSGCCFGFSILACVVTREPSDDNDPVADSSVVVSLFIVFLKNTISAKRILL